MKTLSRSAKREAIAELNEDAMFADDHDNALIGFMEHFSVGPVAVYDKAIVLKNLCERDGMSEEDAEEWFYYNILGSYVGSGTPAFLTFLK